jgi:FlaA1/EpsC-like NDP-sugar epimerase
LPRLWLEVFRSSQRRPPGRAVLIYGAGSAGRTLAEEIHSNPRLGLSVAGFLDDAPSRRRSSLSGSPVLGAGRDAPALVARFTRLGRPVAEIIIAMPSATGRQMRAAIACCRAAGVPYKTVPSLGELIDGRIETRHLREVSVNDLLGREPVRIDQDGIAAALSSRPALVTGGCGSIGSELCRQLARFSPSRLVIFDQAESEMYMLALELRQRFPSLDIVTEIGDIQNPASLESVVAAHSPYAIYHAAAYKHVPLMEAQPLEAVRNNLFGTLNVALAAQQHHVPRFVMISTDKAVNPTSIMGATKRAAELFVSAMPLDRQPCSTTFAAVRFGNVLASAGSVVRIFQRQIAAGGPVTVTHPEMRRYFMSIPEAVQLVLQASIMSRGSEIFVLDMGEPVSIVSLARNMIRLAGYQPDEDIAIRFTGLRPGEKLFEEIHLDSEDILPTYHEKIKIFRSAKPSPLALARWLDEAEALLRTGSSTLLVEHLAQLVPEYGPARRIPPASESPVAAPLQVATHA